MPNDYNLAELISKVGSQQELFESARDFQEMMMRYECAVMEVETKIKILNEEFSMRTQRNPIESIKSRIKSPASIYEKLSRKGYEMTIDNMEQHIKDIAGVRVICSFPEDIYAVARLITEQDDIVILEIKDYIAKPKANGYRSLHLIIAVPIFLANEKRNMKVEIQFRTIAMDFWASLEHKVKYKKNVENPEEIAKELKECADIITSVDYKMQEIEHKTSVIE
ncbi:MAG: GTP pyrophosphokinase family protein [Lachnospiraceae bacterium]|jgi:putative GTP pyrophosphokinase|nr:GTP pyrophosphokinase family protein [Lachnospiraceae bacterium]MBQ9580004.1 GTP pyrophosphokinase family protein [Lachnospiraceae bacterium]MBR0434436.1 GTP pyrophosphokinase family protein [Lachnospiraceae bacterium]